MISGLGYPRAKDIAQATIWFPFALHAAPIKKTLDEYFEASQDGSTKPRLAKDIQFHLTLAEASEESISVQILRYLLDFLYLRFEQELF